MEALHLGLAGAAAVCIVAFALSRLARWRLHTERARRLRDRFSGMDAGQ